MACTSDALVTELRTLAESITSMVEKVSASRSSYTLEQFVNTDRRKENGGMYWLYPVLDYVRCFRALGVKDRVQLGSLCKRRHAEPGVRDAVDALLQSEEDFAGFVSQLDREMKAAEDKLSVSNHLTVGSHLPTELELLDVDSSSVVSLGTILGRAPFTLFVFKRHFI